MVWRVHVTQLAADVGIEAEDGATVNEDLCKDVEDTVVNLAGRRHLLFGGHQLHVLLCGSLSGGLGGIDAALGLVDVEKVGIDAAHHDGIVKHRAVDVELCRPLRCVRDMPLFFCVNCALFACHVGEKPYICSRKRKNGMDQ